MVDYRLVKDHQQQLVSEVQRLRVARTARQSRELTTGGSPDRQSGRSARLPSLLELERALSRKLTLDACRRARRVARRRALAKFSRTHSLWYRSLFGRRSLRALPDDFFARSPASLARSWAAQFPYFREVSRDRDVARLEPIAREFLQLLAEEERRLAVSNC
ncbi:MAG TPA: hypothetical protein VF168_12695 [Trueperaceae bacterium]